MKATDILAVLKHQAGLWFNKRNVIIVSQHKVKHVHISGKMQLAGLGLALTLVFWISYSTGSFMAARQAIKEQAIAAAALHHSGKTVTIPDAVAANDEAPADQTIVSASLEKPELLARLAVLEQQVNELKASKADIIERVREKTSGRIDELEHIIEQTGLKPKDLIKNYAAKGSSKPLGGPYIPANSIAPSAEEKELYEHLDKLSRLRGLLNELPFASPMKKGSLQSGFGRRIDPFNNRLAFHAGLDISGQQNAEIFATADGKIKNAGWSSSYGNHVDIDHGNGISTRYAHLSRILVSEGKKIKKSTVIGLQGSTGRSTGQHLHYEVRYHDQALNPKKFLDAGSHVLEN